MSNPLHQSASSRAANEPIGFYSVCSAHPLVIEAAEQYAAVRAGAIPPLPKELIVHRIREVIRMYANACRGKQASRANNLLSASH